MFQLEHNIDTIVPIWHVLLIRPLLEFYLLLIVATLLLLNELCYFVMGEYMTTIVRVNGTVQFTFVLVMRLSITIVMSCDSLFVIAVP